MVEVLKIDVSILRSLLNLGDFLFITVAKDQLFPFVSDPQHV